jgi:hypothetical protein
MALRGHKNTRAETGKQSQPRWLGFVIDEYEVVDYIVGATDIRA